MHAVVPHGDQEIEEDVDQANLTRRYTDEAIDFIDDHADEPFFVYLPHTMPHIPLHVEEGFRGTSAAGTYGDVIECLDHHVGRLLDHLEARGQRSEERRVGQECRARWGRGGEKEAGRRE